MREHLGDIVLTILLVVFLFMFCYEDEKQFGDRDSVSPSPVATMTPVPTLTTVPTVVTIPATPSPTPTQIPSVVKEVESGHKFKPYTGYWAYNLQGSRQWMLQQIAVTDDRTGIRVVCDPFGDFRYCVALGAFWCGGQPEHIGRCFDAVMVNGSTLKCVLADVKRQEDTNGNANRYGRTNNDLLEFIVQEKMFPENMRGYGDMSRASEELAGDVKEIIVYDMWIEGFGKENNDETD